MKAHSVSAFLCRSVLVGRISYWNTRAWGRCAMGGGVEKLCVVRYKKGGDVVIKRECEYDGEIVECIGIVREVRELTDFSRLLVLDDCGRLRCVVTVRRDKRAAWIRVEGARLRRLTRKYVGDIAFCRDSPIGYPEGTTVCVIARMRDRAFTTAWELVPESDDVYIDVVEVWCFGGGRYYGERKKKLILKFTGGGVEVIE